MEAKNSIALTACKDGLRGRGGRRQGFNYPSHPAHEDRNVVMTLSTLVGRIPVSHLPLHLLSSEKGNRNKKEEIFGMLCLALVTYRILLLAWSLGECYSHGNWGMKGSLQLPKSKREKCLWHAACCSSCYKFTGRFPTVTESWIQTYYSVKGWNTL